MIKESFHSFAVLGDKQFFAIKKLIAIFKRSSKMELQMHYHSQFLSLQNQAQIFTDFSLNYKLFKRRLKLQQFPFKEKI